MNQSPNTGRRRRWLIFLPSALLLLVAACWAGAWFYAAAHAETMMASWREHEARLGRVYACGTQTIGGFPFRFEVRCADPSGRLGNFSPPVLLRAKEMLAVAQIYQPTLILSEITGPLTVGEPNRPAAFVANWTLAQSSVRIIPIGSQRISTVVTGPTVDRSDAGTTARVLQADKIEVHGRLAAGSTADNPVHDLVLRLAAASAPDLHPVAAQPLDAEITGVLRGLTDFAPKPWPARFRELQARGGRLDISSARLQQGDVIAVGAGSLGLTARGGIDGQLQVTVVNLDKLLNALGIDRAVAEGRAGAALDALDRLMPGLGNLARQNPGASVVAGLGMLGQNTTLEGKPAVTLPLRFSDGVAFLGPFQLGRTPPLF